MPSTGGRFLLTGDGYKPQGGNSDISFCRNVSPGYFFVLNRSKFGKIYGWKGSHGYIFSPDSEKQKLALILNVDAIQLPPSSVFVGHGYSQHVGAELLGHGSLRYHAYLFSDDMTIHDSIVFGYDWNQEIASPVKGIRVQETELAAPNVEAILNLPIVKKQT